jgi:hypothetical protein
MNDKAPSFFDTFTGAESDLMTAIIADVKNEAWAKPIIAAIDRNGGLRGANKPLFFELRFGHALKKAGVNPGYEIPGEGESTLDFGFDSKGKKWNVEMMRLEETSAAKAATKTGTDAEGVTWSRRIMSSANEDKKQSTEGETLKAVERICQKFERDGKAHKFLPPDQAVNALLVDFRTFSMNGGDVGDWCHVGYGGEWVKPEYRMYWGEGEKRRLITGVFNPKTTLKGSAEARERLHLIGIVNERAYKEDGFNSSVRFIANPHLFKTPEELKPVIDSWPLGTMEVLNNK